MRLLKKEKRRKFRAEGGRKEGEKGMTAGVTEEKKK